VFDQKLLSKKATNFFLMWTNECVLQQIEF
jgi:hypothetical protein